MAESMESVRAAQLARGRREERAVLIRRLFQTLSPPEEPRSIARSGPVARLLAGWAAEVGVHR